MFKQDYKVSKGGKFCAQTVDKLWHPAKYINGFYCSVKSMKMMLPHFSCFSGKFLTFFGVKQF